MLVKYTYKPKANQLFKNIYFIKYICIINIQVSFEKGHMFFLDDKQESNYPIFGRFKTQTEYILSDIMNNGRKSE